MSSGVNTASWDLLCARVVTIPETNGDFYLLRIWLPIQSPISYFTPSLAWLRVGPLGELRGAAVPETVNDSTVLTLEEAARYGR